MSAVVDQVHFLEGPAGTLMSPPSTPNSSDSPPSSSSQRQGRQTAIHHPVVVHPGAPRRRSTVSVVDPPSRPT